VTGRADGWLAEDLSADEREAPPPETLATTEPVPAALRRRLVDEDLAAGAV
jgi:hypothetical protein